MLYMNPFTRLHRWWLSREADSLALRIAASRDRLSCIEEAYGELGFSHDGYVESILNERECLEALQDARVSVISKLNALS